MLTDADLAYVAAVVDTLALLKLRETPASSLPEVHVNNPNVPLLEHLSALTGVAHIVTRRQYDKHRCSVHCASPHAHVDSTSGRWSVTGARATVLLHNVHPFLRLRADDAAELIRAGLAAGWKSNSVRGMVELGWAIPDMRHQPRVRSDWRVVS